MHAIRRMQKCPCGCRCWDSLTTREWDIPMWLLTATEVPAEWPSTFDTKQGSTAMDHLAFLAVCSACERKCPSGIFSSCPRTMSAVEPSMYVATSFPQLGLTVSMAQNPAALCEPSYMETDSSPGQFQALGPCRKLLGLQSVLFLLGCLALVAGATLLGAATKQLKSTGRSCTLPAATAGAASSSVKQRSTRPV